MQIDFTEFGLTEMLRCSAEVRKAAEGASTMEAAADRICRTLHEGLLTPDGARACALVRCYKTHQFRKLEPELQQFAQRLLGPKVPDGAMRCLTLLATCGDEDAWNSRERSVGHQAIPLPSAEIVEKAPMIAQLIREMGLSLTDVIKPTKDLVRELAGKTYGVFYVAEAPGSPYIPAQTEFVHKFGIRSVVGCGGMLPSGDLFAVILFSRVPLTSTTADRFRNVALDIKSAFFRYRDNQIFRRAGDTADGLPSARDRSHQLPSPPSGP